MFVSQIHTKSGLYLELNFQKLLNHLLRSFLAPFSQFLHLAILQQEQPLRLISHTAHKHLKLDTYAGALCGRNDFGKMLKSFFFSLDKSLHM